MQHCQFNRHPPDSKPSSVILCLIRGAPQRNLIAADPLASQIVGLPAS
jgi:hypothetical protein